MKTSPLLRDLFYITLLFSSLTAPAAPPATPEYVKVAWIKNHDEFLVRWHPVPDATGYNVYRYDTNATAWVQVTTNLSVPQWNVLSFRDPAPGDTGPRTYAVTALNGDGEGPSAAASVVPGPGLIGSFTAQWDWWPKGYTFIDPGFYYDQIDEPTDGMVEFGLNETNFSHAAWETDFDLGHSLHITNMPPGTVWVTRMTMVNSNGIGVSFLYPPWGVYTLPLTPIDVWEDTANQIAVGDSTWIAPAQVFTPPSHGTVTPDWYYQNWLYTPQSNFTGTDTFQILDNPDGPPVTITLNVQNINDTPVPYDFTVYVPEDTTVLITPPVTDIENDPYNVWAWDYPANGMLLSQGSSSFVYTPNPDFVGTDPFTYFAMDEQWLGIAAATIIVTNVNDPPQAENVFVTGSEDAPLTFGINASDVDGDAVTLEIVDPPLNGMVTNVGLTITYSPNANYWGGDYFTYRVSDGETNSGVATVNINVDPVNDAPAAEPVSAITAEDTIFIVPYSGADPDGDPYGFEVVNQPQHGAVMGDLYQPAANYVGTDTFTYRTFDGVAYSAPATVTLTITPVNDPPSANDQSVSTAYNTAVNIMLAGSDVEGSALTYTTLSLPTNGVLTGTGANRSFTPTIGWYGTTSFTFKVNDGELDSATGTVSVTVESPGSAPAAPSGLAAITVSQSQIDLAWNDNSGNEDGFKIERATGSSGPWTQIATVGPGVTTYASTGLSKNKRYYYRVHAYNVLGNSAYSNTAGARTQN